jgi:hypothetical protein
VIGLIGRFGDVERVPDVLERADVLLLTAVLSTLEFVADKIPTSTAPGTPFTP